MSSTTTERYGLTDRDARMRARTSSSEVCDGIWGGGAPATVVTRLLRSIDVGERDGGDEFLWARGEVSRPRRLMREGEVLSSTRVLADVVDVARATRSRIDKPSVAGGEDWRDRQAARAEYLSGVVVGLRALPGLRALLGLRILRGLRVRVRFSTVTS
jgi:hypothetical protein